MEIRNYKGIDYPQLIRLLKSVYDSEIIQSVLEQNYISDTKSILVAVDEVKGKLIGCTFIEEKTDYIRPEKTLFITYVAVDEDYRHQGIGKRLI